MEKEVHRDLGKHDAQIVALQERVESLHADLAKLFEQLQEINCTLSEARGGWRTLMAAAGLASAVTAGAIKLLGYIPWE